MGADPAAITKLAHDFYFPSGRQCRTYDELVQGCHEEWEAARDLLAQGVFQQYFAGAGRNDLAKASQEAQAQPDRDMGLSALLTSLPTTAAVQGPKLDLNPRRIFLGKLNVGEVKKISLRIINTGQGILQGSVTAIEGGEWLQVGATVNNGHYSIKTTTQQDIPMVVDTRTLAAAQSYLVKLRVITNGGVVEVPVGFDLIAQPFPKAPFQRASKPRELAQGMRDNPKAAVPLLESGEVAQWFAHNNWNYPISGTPARGVAGVQQFFEAMGLSKPPAVQLTEKALRLPCKVPDTPRARVSLFTPSKKYVYGNVSSDAPWLTVLTPSVSGAQKANIDIQIESRQLPRGKFATGTIQVICNGGKKLVLPVQVEVQRPVAGAMSKMLQPILTLALAFFLIRALFVPLVDLGANHFAVNYAYAKADIPITQESRGYGNWLALPWLSITLGQSFDFPEHMFPKQGEEVGEGEVFTQEEIREQQKQATFNSSNFRDYFFSRYCLIVVCCTWWVGIVVALILLYQQNGKFIDMVWGVISGAVLGVIIGATLACLLLLGDLIPHTIWGILFGGGKGSPVMVIAWGIFVVLFWTATGAALGFLTLLTGPIGKAIRTPIQEALAWLFRLCGLRGMANFCAAQ